MLRIFYTIVGAVVFVSLSVGVFLLSEFYADRWESERLLSLELKDTKGRPWKIPDLKSKIGIIYFGYTFCPDVCPTALSDLIDALEKIETNRHLYQPIFISVDPDRDSKNIIGEYVAHFDPNIIGLTGSKTQLKSFTFNMGATYSIEKKHPTDKDYLVNHTAGYFLITSSGKKLPLPLSKSLNELIQALIKVTKRINADK